MSFPHIYFWGFFKISPGANNPEEFLLHNVRIVHCWALFVWFSTDLWGFSFPIKNSKDPWSYFGGKMALVWSQSLHSVEIWTIKARSYIRQLFQTGLFLSLLLDIAHSIPRAACFNFSLKLFQLHAAAESMKGPKVKLTQIGALAVEQMATNRIR